MPFHLIEPHPSVPNTHYIASGRGGAGNYKHVDPRSITPPATAHGRASVTTLPPPPSSSRFSGGRGGAGNMYHNSERAMFSFDEELAQQQTREERAAPVYHIGRGGAGNAVDEARRPAGADRRKGSASSTMSRDSDGNGKARRSIEGVLGRLSQTFAR
ncbi:MAG: hypothetical protein M1827_003684 [Pycnora praestabilis]|nr:MAG: hypothetical protein M1827_003684 [Pycnora praestabilis]